jgi:hypothetical protein
MDRVWQLLSAGAQAQAEERRIAASAAIEALVAGGASLTALLTEALHRAQSDPRLTTAVAIIAQKCEEGTLNDSVSPAVPLAHFHCSLSCQELKSQLLLFLISLLARKHNSMHIEGTCVHAGLLSFFRLQRCRRSLDSRLSSSHHLRHSPTQPPRTCCTLCSGKLQTAN